MIKVKLKQQRALVFLVANHHAHWLIDDNIFCTGMTQSIRLVVPFECRFPQRRFALILLWVWTIAALLKQNQSYTLLLSATGATLFVIFLITILGQSLIKMDSLEIYEKTLLFVFKIYLIQIAIILVLRQLNDNQIINFSTLKCVQWSTAEVIIYTHRRVFNQQVL